jgi:Flp pilus assembly protein protease CpaA
MVSGQSFLMMFAIGFLLFKFRVLGGGDIKALCIVSLFLNPIQLQNLLAYSLIWAAAYAFIFYIISGQLLKVFSNTINVFQRITTPDSKIPFTFGILLGWFSLFTIGALTW